MPAPHKTLIELETAFWQSTNSRAHAMIGRAYSLPQVVDPDARGFRSPLTAA